MRLAILVALLLAPAAAAAKKETAGPSLSGAYAIDPDAGEGDFGLALGFEGRASGAPSIGAGMDLGWAFAAESAFLDLHFGAGWSVVTIGPGVQLDLGVPGFGLAVGGELQIAIPFPFVGDASLASIFARADYFVVGDDDFPHQVGGGLRFVLDTTRSRN